MEQWGDVLGLEIWGFVILRNIASLVALERVDKCVWNGNCRLWNR